MFQETLNQIGLTLEQADIYQTLLDKGSLSATQIAKNTKVKRTYVYNVCKQLMQKGLVSQEKQGKTTLFYALSPDRLLDQAVSQKHQAEQAISSLESILPSLKQKFAAIDSKPIITYYEGESGIMKANMEVLAEKKTILAYLIINEKIDKKMDSFWRKYYKLRIENNIHVKAITPDTAAGKNYQKRDAQELRETRLVPKEKFPFAIEKNIVGNKVVFFSTKDNTLIATIIENKEIADTERAIFELAWQQSN